MNNLGHKKFKQLINPFGFFRYLITARVVKWSVFHL